MLSSLTPGFVSLLAAIRPRSLDAPLFVHVAGAMVLVGCAATGVRLAFVGGDPPLAAWSRRLVFRTFLLAALPAFVVMRIGAEWIRMREIGDASVSWVTFGYSTADGGGVLLIVALVLAWLAVRRDRTRLTKVAAVLMGLVVLAWLVTAWVMAAKPG
jgi:hypothetical protein